jgi:hypothetical protein
MPERHGLAYRHHLRHFGRAGSVDAEAEVRPGPPEQGGVAGWVGGRREQQDLGGSRQAPDLAEESGLQALAQRKRFGQRVLIVLLCGHRGEGRQRAQRAAPLGGVRFHIGLHHLAAGPAAGVADDHEAQRRILATFAEFEVDLPRMRTKEGMALARAASTPSPASPRAGRLTSPARRPPAATSRYCPARRRADSRSPRRRRCSRCHC